VKEPFHGQRLQVQSIHEGALALRRSAHTGEINEIPRLADEQAVFRSKPASTESPRPGHRLARVGVAIFGAQIP
jgi:hypothetical protein